MNLSVGIIGLTNVGKSTLFNALCARRLAETAPRPFTTIEPHEAVVPVPDGNLEKLANYHLDRFFMLASKLEIISKVNKFIKPKKILTPKMFFEMVK